MRQAICIAVLLFAILITGCGPAIPDITIENESPIPVIVTVVGADNGLTLLSMSPGEKQEVVPGADGHYRVAVAPNNEWFETARAARVFLNDKLKNAILTKAEIVDLQNRLDSIDNKIDALVRPRSSDCEVQLVSPGCSDSYTGERFYMDGYAKIAQESNGALVLYCSSVGKK